MCKAAHQARSATVASLGAVWNGHRCLATDCMYRIRLTLTNCDDMANIELHSISVFSSRSVPTGRVGSSINRSFVKSRLRR